MNTNDEERLPKITDADEQELTRLIKQLERRDDAMVVFAITPGYDMDCAVVQQLRWQLKDRKKQDGEGFAWYSFKFNQEQSLCEFLDTLESQECSPSKGARQLVMAFGLEDLPPHRVLYEMQQLNLGRERLFSHNLVLIFWLKREEMLNDFRTYAQDFWDWRVGKLFTFETKLPLDPELHPHQHYYPYLEWMMERNRYLQNTGVLQVQKQVDMPLDQVYVSLQAQRSQPKAADGEGRTEQNMIFSESALENDLSEVIRDEKVSDMSRESDPAT